MLRYHASLMFCDGNIKILYVLIYIHTMAKKATEKQRKVTTCHNCGLLLNKDKLGQSQEIANKMQRTLNPYKSRTFSWIVTLALA